MDRIEAIAQLAIIRHAVSQYLVCMKSGRVLDYRRTVVVTITHPNKPDLSATLTYDGEAYDKIRKAESADPFDFLKGDGYNVEVLDAREIRREQRRLAKAERDARK